MSGASIGEIPAPERLFHRLAEVSPVGLFRADSAGRLLYVNERWCAISGIASKAAVGRPWADFVSPPDRGLIDRSFSGRLKAGTSLSTECRYGAAEAWVIVEVVEERGEGGTPAGVIGSLTDISERKRMEDEVLESRRSAQETNAALRHSEERFRSVVDNAPMGIFHSTLAGRLVFANRALAGIMGYRSPDELVAAANGQAAPGLLYERPSERESIYAEALRQPGWKRFLINFRRKDGRVVVTNLRVRAKTSPSGEEVVIEGFVEDITERVEAEEAFRESQYRFKQLFDNMTAGFAVHRMIWDREGKAVDCRYLAMNAAFEQIIGRKAADCVGRTAREIWAGSALPRLADFGEVARTGAPKNFQEYSPSIEKHLELRAFSPEKDCFALIAVDITERLEAERREKERTRQLIQSEKLASLGLVIAGVAHEINNPNHAIMLNARLVSDVWASLRPILDARLGEEVLLGGLEYGELRASMPGIIKGVEEASSDIERIVRGLKGFAAMDDEVAEDLDLNAVVSAAAALLAGFIKRSTDMFRLELADSLPPLRANFQRLEQVLVNLIQNACQALEGRDKSVVVTSRYDEARGKLVATVRDEGRGMDARVLARVKDPFFTTKRQKGGLGLGVSISNTIVEEYGGSLAYRSAPGAGTQAILEFPVAEAATKE